MYKETSDHLFLHFRKLSQVCVIYLIRHASVIPVKGPQL